MFEDIDEEIKLLIKRARKSSENKGWIGSIFGTTNHQEAAELYSDAAKKLKYVNRNKEAAECYSKSADEYIVSKCSGYLFFAAEAYTSSYELLSDKQLMFKACELYCMNDSYSLAAKCRKDLLKKQEGEEALERLDFIVMCYEKAGMSMNTMHHVEQKGVVCLRLKRYKEAGDCFRECGKVLYAFLAYFLVGDEVAMKELDFEHEVIMSFYGGDRIKDAKDALSKYMEYNAISDDYMGLFNDVLERLKPEYDIL